MKKFALIIPLFIFLSACSFVENMDAATEFVDDFHSNLSTNDTQSIIESLSSEFTEDKIEEFQTLSTQINDSLGTVISTERTHFTISSKLGKGTTVNVQHTTVFEKGTATEKFILKKEEGDIFKLFRYDLNNVVRNTNEEIEI